MEQTFATDLTTQFSREWAVQAASGRLEITDAGTERIEVVA